MFFLYITGYHSNNATCLKHLLILALSAYNSTTSSIRDPHFLLSNCNKHDEMQRCTKFKNILWRGFRATLSFRKFKVALKPLETVASLLKCVFT